MTKKSRREGWAILEVGRGRLESAARKYGWVLTKKKVAPRVPKGGRFLRASEEKVAAVQHSFEKARRGKSLFGLEDAE
jgi:hypothetical protein